MGERYNSSFPASHWNPDERALRSAMLYDIGHPLSRWHCLASVSIALACCNVCCCSAERESPRAIGGWVSSTIEGWVGARNEVSETGSRYEGEFRYRCETCKVRGNCSKYTSTVKKRLMQITTLKGPMTYPRCVVVEVYRRNRFWPSPDNNICSPS